MKLKVRPWRITASRYVHKDRWISVRADDCVTEAGTRIAPYYVLEYPDWVHIVAVTPEHQLVLRPLDIQRRAIAAAARWIMAAKLWSVLS